MPSTLILSIESNEGPHPGLRELHRVEVPDLPADLGRGSRLFAETVAARGVSVIARGINRKMNESELPA